MQRDCVLGACCRGIAGSSTLAGEDRNWVGRSWPCDPAMFGSCLADGRIFNGRIGKDVSQLMFGDRPRLVARSDQAEAGCGVFAAGVRAREQVIRQYPFQVLSTMPV